MSNGWSALADGTRRAIVASLADGPQFGWRAGGRVPGEQAGCPQHLKVLKDAGLVSEHQEGTRRIYQLNPVALAALRDQLDTYWQRALTRYAEVVSNDARGPGEGEDRAEQKDKRP